MRRNHSGFPSIVNLDSLVDIVSNSVGILIILAVFIALLTLAPIPIEPEQEEKLLTEGIQRIRIPWSHSSQKNSLLFVLRDNRLWYLDRVAVYEKIHQQLASSQTPDMQMNFSKYSVELIAQNNNNHCLEFSPERDTGIWWGEAIGSTGVFPKLMQKYSPNEMYFFFWADAASFELFRKIRQWLWEQKYEVGWKPITPKSALRYCTGASRSLSFQPQ